jgi:sporulation protein YunB
MLALSLLSLVVIGFELSLRNAARTLTLARAPLMVIKAINQCSFGEEYAKWYGTVVHIERNTSGEIQSVQIDGFAINQLSNQLALDIEQNVEKLAQETLTLSLMSVLGTASIGVGGPRFRVECRALPAVDIQIHGKFDQAGINQTRHSLYADIRTNVRFIVAGKVVAYESTDSILLCETIIVGNVPDTYLQSNYGDVHPTLPLQPVLPLVP